MRDNETGETELVLGNKQLLSGFFIVVVLCSVAFAMGYVVGQNSPHGSKQAADQAAQSGSAQDARPQPASPAPPVSLPVQPSTASPPAQTAESGSSVPDPGPPPPQPSTHAVRDATSAPAPATQAPPPPAADAVPGSYWQVLATRNQESARDLAQTLKDKGFPASVSTAPDNLMHVMIGPYTDTASLGRAKTALENAGFRPVRK